MYVTARTRRLSALVSICLLLAACGSSSSSSNVSDGGSGGGDGRGVAESQTSFDQILTAADGEDVAFTVYVPENPRGDTTPLIIHSHGFGLSRAKDLESPNPIEAFLTKDTSGTVARQAWLEQGYYVISFDQRGFGDSSGQISLMDPDVDCRNVSQMIDWAEQNLPNLAFDNGDPMIGSIGLSYGGGFQTVCSSVDTRFDAIVPLATWSHLPYSLYPNSTPKNLWLDFLAVASMGNLESELAQALITATTTGEIAQETVDRIATHGPRSFCEGMREDGRTASSADALFIQGSHDVLFNINEAVENYECWKSHGQEAHLIVQRDGHILPVLQESGQLIAFGGDETLYCGDQVFDTATLAMEFLNSKLKGTALSQTIPDVCFSLMPEQSGHVTSTIARGGLLAPLPGTGVSPGALSSVVNLLQSLPLQTVITVLAGLPGEAINVLTAVLGGLTDPTSIADNLDEIINLLPPELISKLVAAPQFIPLHTASSDGVLAGIPLANVTVEGGNGDANVLYFGLGLLPAGGGDPVLINDQVLPLEGTSIVQPLIGVSAAVAEGDTVGLMVYGFHPYFLHLAALVQPPIPATISGSIDLPFIADAP